MPFDQLNFCQQIKLIENLKQVWLRNFKLSIKFCQNLKSQLTLTLGNKVYLKILKVSVSAFSMDYKTNMFIYKICK